MNCCSHLFEIGNVTPITPNGCEECLKMGDRCGSEIKLHVPTTALHYSRKS